MIFFFHTPDHGSVMVGSDHVPRIGEILRLTDHPEFNAPDLMVGLFKIQQVMYVAPNNPGHQRIDVYGRRISDLPGDLSYSAVMDAVYQDELAHA